MFYLVTALITAFVLSILILALEWNEVKLKRLSVVFWLLQSISIGILLSLIWSITLTILVIFFVYLWYAQEFDE